MKKLFYATMFSALAFAGLSATAASLADHEKTLACPSGICLTAANDRYVKLNNK